MSAGILTECDPDGVLTLTFNDPTRSMNVLSNPVIRELACAIDAAIEDPAVKGLLLRSGKASFVAGADLRELLATLEKKPTLAEGFALSQRLQQALRRLETCGKPVVAAINGTALGGGLELCLACHYRVLTDDPTALIGLPEVTLGLLPGGGGTQRLPREIGIAAALPLMTRGTALTPRQALELGIVDALAPPEKTEACARAWLATAPSPSQPWDRKGYLLPGGGVMSAPVAQAFMLATAHTAKTTQRNYPAPMAILSAVFEGCNVPIDAGLTIESKHFATLVSGPVPRNMIRTLFVGKGMADKLAYRPPGIAPVPVNRLGIIGAGMTGAGVAYVAARAGLSVVLLDSSKALAQLGRTYLEGMSVKEVDRGGTTAAAAAASLERITPTADDADLAGCDLVVEAVAGSAPAAQRRDQFIGLHFFSSVDEMPLVEIIVGGDTSLQTVARALDFVAKIRKTPIVIKDGPGFYTSRVFGTYTTEGMKLLEEGVSPALIENAAISAGMPVGPLAKRMGLDDMFPRAANQPSVEDVKQRLLHIQALESSRCVEEGVITRPSDADIGSVFGIGFPSYTGGTLSYIDTIGIQRFVADCTHLAARCGARFQPSPWLIERAARGTPFHGTQ